MNWSLARLGQVVTFYVPVYSPAAVQSLEFDDITVRGNLTLENVIPPGDRDRLFFRVRQE